MAPPANRIRRCVGLREFRRKNILRRGNNFCQVDRIRHIGHERPAITFGNQKWAGATPALVIRPNKTNHLGSK